MFSSALADQAIDIVQTLQTLAQDYDWSEFYDIGPGGRVGVEGGRGRGVEAQDVRG